MRANLLIDIFATEPRAAGNITRVTYMTVYVQIALREPYKLW